MTLHLIDHIVFVLLAVVFPIWDFFWLRKRAARILAGETELRMKLYHRTIGQEWVMAVALLGLWFALGRDAGAIGLVLQGGAWAWAGYGLAVVACALIGLQAWSIIRSPEKGAALLAEFSSLSFLFPHTLKERRTFDAVSVTAGICEEVIYRGFMIAYLMALFGAPFWVAGLVSSIVFGLAHSYQGPAGIPRTAAAGGVMALLYGLTGSLWAPMVAHAVMDVAAGRLTYTAFSKIPPASRGTIPPRERALGETG